jgi:transcriptional regulator with AAA-type ATPase domain
MHPEDIRKRLEQSMLFKNLDSAQLDIIASQATVRHVREGDFVHKKGDRADTFYVVAVGEAELTYEMGDGTTSTVARVGPGGHFGETSLLTFKPQSLTVTALCDLVLICFKDTFFRQLLRSQRLIQERVELALAERLRISFQDHAASVLACDLSTRKEVRLVDMVPMADYATDGRSIIGEKNKTVRSQSAREIQRAITKFVEVDTPVLISGEPGTGRRLMAKHIHLQSHQLQRPYIEVNARDFDTDGLAIKLFGGKNDPFPFLQVGQAGVLEQFCRGTVVINHIDRVALPIQKKIADAIETSMFTRVGGGPPVALQTRIIFVSEHSVKALKRQLKLIKNLEQVIGDNHFNIPALRLQKRELPQLVDYYLDRFSREYGKNIQSVDPETLGILMNYDWPGNMIELSAVIQRAVMLSRDGVLRSDHILLGLPKSEGKWEFNLLRVSWIRRLLQSRLYPAVPRAFIGAILLFTVLTLFFGPKEPGNNIGITISWVIGWPLMFFSFFFMARIWRSL